MINKVLSAVCTALYDEFGYEVYTERIEQGLEEPCFFVECISPDIELTIKNRRLHSYQFAIVFFPEDDAPNKAINSVIERLYDSIEEIYVEGDLIRGNGIETAVTDNVLTFTITYNFFMVNPDTEENMADIELNAAIKEAANDS